MNYVKEEEFVGLQNSDISELGTYQVKYKIGDKTLVPYHAECSLWGIKFWEGGPVPSELSGKYTSQKLAIQGIEDYLTNKQKGETNEKFKFKSIYPPAFIVFLCFLTYKS